MHIREKAAWGCLAALGLFVVATMSGVVSGGPLDPAGSPAPTMKTLDDIPGSWSRELVANNGASGPNPPAGCNSSRFQCVFGNQAVHDRETGLVWMRQVQTNTNPWNGLCNSEYAGGRSGFHLPTKAELETLVDTQTVTPPWLPVGHPFLDVSPSAYYWTASSYDDANAVVMNFSGGAGIGPRTLGEFRVWCVRGGPGVENR